MSRTLDPLGFFLPLVILLTKMILDAIRPGEQQADGYLVQFDMAHSTTCLSVFLEAPSLD
jgi:hypothetical protein